MKAILLATAFLLGTASAVKVTIKFDPPSVAAKVFLLSASGAGCGDDILRKVLNCSVTPGAYALSVFPNLKYGAVVERPVTISKTGTLIIKLSPPIAGEVPDTEDWSSFTYRVKSTCPTNVTYSEDNSTQQESSVDDGWTAQTLKRSFVYLSAQLTCTGGVVTTYILLGGKVIKQATSRGDYVIAQVSYP